MKTKLQVTKHHKQKTNVFWRWGGLIVGLCLLAVFSTRTTTASSSNSLAINPDFVYLITEGSRANLEAVLTGSFPEKPMVSWSVDNPAVLDLKVDDENTVEIEAKVPLGTTVVTATYQDLSATAKIIVGYGIESDPLSILLTDESQGSNIDLQIYDILEGFSVSWEVSDPKVLSLYPNNQTAQVRANVPVGSAIVTATYRNVSIEIPVVIATLEAETKAIDPDYIESIDVSYEGSTITDIIVVLQNNVSTKDIVPGDIVINSANTKDVHALAVRVTDVSVSKSYITVQGIPATLEETYQYLDINLEFAQTTFSPEMVEGGQSPESIISLFCATNTSLASVEMTAFEISMPAMPIQPIATIQIGDNGLEYLFLGADIEAGFTVQGPTLDIAAQASFEFECNIPIPKLGALLTFPIPSTPLLLNIAPSFGIEGSVAVQFAEASITLGDLSFQYSARFGVLFDGAEWSSVSEDTDPDFQAELFTFDNNWGIEFQVEFYPRLRGDVGIGVAPIPPWILNLRILSTKLGVMSTVTVAAEAIIYSPLPPDSNYINPEWRSSKLVTAELDIGLGGILGPIIQDYIDDEAPPIVDIELVLRSLELVVGETADITLAASETPVPPDTMIDLSIEVRPFGTGSMIYRVYVGRQVDIWASKDDTAAFLIGSGFVDELGNVHISWTPTEEGKYEIAALVFDRLTGAITLPFMTESRVVTVGDEENRLKWSFDANDSVLSSAALSNDEATVYVGSFDNNLYALNSSDGSLQWSFGTGTFIQASPAVAADGTIYLPSADDSLYALNPNGSLKWSFAAGHNIHSPAIGADGTIYVGSADCNLYALDPGTGVEEWHLTLGSGSSCWAYSPIVGPDGTIYTRREWVSSGNPDRLIAIEPNGTVKWTHDSQQFESFGMPAIAADGTLIIMGWDLYSISPNNGSVQWTFDTLAPLPVSGEDYSSPAIGADGTIYVVDGAGHLNAVSADGNSLLWRTSLGQAHFQWSSPAIGVDGTIYVGSTDDNLYAISASGNVLWSFLTGLDVQSSPALGADGTLYIGSHDGYIYALETDSLGLDSGPWAKFRHDNGNTGLGQLSFKGL